jgi:type II secretory ATPase GspE/PulE/Tfp pilus assembly ATPase PilB-like protein
MEIPKETVSKKSLGEILVESDLIYLDQLENALELQSSQGKDLGEVLIEQSLITPNDLAMALSIHLNMPLIDLKRHLPTPRALKMIPVEMARKHTLIPLDIVGDLLVVVMADPTNIRVIEDLQAQSKMRVEPSLGIPSKIHEAINLYYRASAEIEKRVREFATPELESIQFETDAFGQTPVTETLDLLITQAVRDRASDVHIEPQEDELRIRYRIDGVLRDTDHLPLNAKSPMISSIKIMAGMNIAEQRRPQDGQFTIMVEQRTVDVRVATTETIYGERVTLRILDKERSLIDLHQLGFLPDTLGKYQEMLKSSFGMMLICGPTGSGKTTTLYASINQLDRNESNIMTVEDPVEYRLAGINQIQVNEKAGKTFATSLRSLMRHDPDTIMVGEIRDGETADIACQAALTGHLVLSSVHANDTVGAIFRLMDVGTEPYIIASSLVGIIAQRMIRRICPHCHDTFVPDEKELAAYEKEMGQEPIAFFRGTGCNFCNTTGYLGRMGVFEVLVISDAIRDMIVCRATAGDLRTTALKEGMVTMRHDGMTKVREQITTPAEVQRGIFSVGQ